MSDLFWPGGAQMACPEPYDPTSHGKPRADGRRVPKGIIFINRDGLPTQLQRAVELRTNCPFDLSRLDESKGTIPP